MGELLKDSLLGSINKIESILPLVRAGFLTKREGAQLLVKMFPKAKNYHVLCAAIKEGVILAESPWVRQMFAQWLAGPELSVLYAAVDCQVFTKEEVKPFFFSHAYRGTSEEFWDIMDEAYQRGFIHALEFSLLKTAHFSQGS
jgi:hypothetical protein